MDGHGDVTPADQRPVAEAAPLLMAMSDFTQKYNQYSDDTIALYNVGRVRYCIS